MSRRRHFLHVCGGVSSYVAYEMPLSAFSPRMWRCFYSLALPSLRRRDFLHVCGGVSKEIFVQGTDEEFSPRMWRCFLDSYTISYLTIIFSTYVEVFPSASDSTTPQGNFLHVCGGVSKDCRSTRSRSSFSPRMWRCFQGDKTLKT